MANIETAAQAAIAAVKTKALTIFQKNVWWFMLGAFIAGIIVGHLV